MNLDAMHILWQRVLLDNMKIGGIWTIPTGGAQVKKIGEDTVYIDDFGTNKLMITRVIAHIEAAGYTVTNKPPAAQGNGRHSGERKV